MTVETDTQKPNCPISSWVLHSGHTNDSVRTAHTNPVGLTPCFQSSDPRVFEYPYLNGSGPSQEQLEANHFLLDQHLFATSNVLDRLAGITQNIFSPIFKISSRYSHSREVADIAQTIAQRLGLNEVLAHTIGLGHDCGHGPGGHIFEDTVSEIFGKQYEHGEQATVMLRQSSDLFHPETLDGIRKHSWRCETPMTAEAEVVAWADRIAYIVSDFLDGYAFGLVTHEQLKSDPRVDCEIANRMHMDPELVRDYFIKRLVNDSRQAGFIGMNVADTEKLLGLRRFNIDNIIHSDFRRCQDEMFRNVLDDLFKATTNKDGELVFARSANRPEAGQPQHCGAIAFLRGMRDVELFNFHAAVHGTPVVHSPVRSLQAVQY